VAQIDLLRAGLKTNVATAAGIITPFNAVATRVRDVDGGGFASKVGRWFFAKLKPWALPLFGPPGIGQPAAHPIGADLHSGAVVAANAEKVDIVGRIVNIRVEIGEAHFVLEQIAHVVARARAGQDPVV